MAAAEAVALLDSLRAQAAEVTSLGREMLRRVRGGKLETREGISLLHLRSQSLLSYLQDLTLLISTKIQGKSLKSQISTQNSNFPTQNSNFPTQNSSNSAQNSSISTQKSEFSTQNSSISTQNSNFSTQKSEFSTQNSDFSTQKSEFSTQNSNFSTQKSSSGALERLLETRVVLEKLRPLEQNLKYQLEKLLRAATSGGRGTAEPLSYRPAPSNMAAAESEEEGAEPEPEVGGAKAPGLGGGRRYVPPRIVPVMCDFPNSEDKSKDSLRRRALSSSVLRELREELGEEPREEGEGLFPKSREEIDRRRYEESMLQRLGAPWRPKRKKGAWPGMGDVTNFGAFPALLAANQESSEIPKKKRKKGKLGKRKGREGFAVAAEAPIEISILSSFTYRLHLICISGGLGFVLRGRGWLDLHKFASNLGCFGFNFGVLVKKN